MTGDWRTIVATLVIGTSACAAGWHFLVEAPRRDVSRLREQRATLESSLERAGAIQVSLPELLLEREAAHEAMRSVSARAQAARDANEMYGEITRTATRCGLRIDELRPLPPAARRKPVAGVNSMSYRMRVSGEYGSVAKFVGELAGGPGFVRVGAVQVSPGPRPGEVAAVIETEHVSLSPAGTSEAGKGQGA
jgi:Tfp pilus assembly protein PilO